jgi:hypothetical protein
LRAILALGERRLYELWDGSAFTIRGGKCGGDDARESFDVVDLNADDDGNMPTQILRELARNVAAQAVQAFGGADRLRAEIKNQRIDFDALSPERQRRLTVLRHQEVS